MLPKFIFVVVALDSVLFFKETIDNTLLTSVTTKETYFFHREKKKSEMLLKTLMLCYFRHGWGSRALGTENRASWAALVVMDTVSWITSRSTNWPGLSWNPWHFQFPKSPSINRGANGAGGLPGPFQFLQWMKENYTFWLFLKWSGGRCFYVLCF